MTFFTTTEDPMTIGRPHKYLLVLLFLLVIPLAVLFLHLLSGCLSPVRPEPPSPPPVVDAFVDLVVDCRDVEVVDEVTSALAPTRACLERVDAYECLVSASRLLMRSTIACAVSQNGNNAALQLERGDESGSSVARTAKTWILDHRIRFR